MKILLIGEYSGVHTELCIALKKKGYIVKTISDGDGYKLFPTDIKVNSPISYNNHINKISFTIYLLLVYTGLKGIFDFIKIWKSLKKEIKGYDVVQLINPVALTGFGSVVNLFLLHYLKKHNKKIFLCALGDDYYWVKNNMKKESKYIALKDINCFNFYKQLHSTKYTYGFMYKKLNNYAVKISTKIIPGVYDYKRVYSWSDKISKLVPLPIDNDYIGYPIKIIKNEKIIIFHGWQKGKELRKGNIIFDIVAKKICKNFPDKVIYKIVQNVPYKEYIKTFNSCHIAFDQCFGFDKGVNGLLFMAAGKVTFTGMEKEAISSYPFYDSEKIYGINATPNEDYLYTQLSILINNPKIIEKISLNAISFVLDNHRSDYVANLYLEIWKG